MRSGVAGGRGGDDYFPKDAITSEVLGRAIHQAMEKFRLDAELRDGNEQIIFALAAAVKGKDPITEGHLKRMARYCVQLGQAMDMGEHELRILKYGAILHDIGKMAVSTAMLSKPGPLTESEWEKMRQHPIVGERICAPLRFSAEVGPVIRHHHERWDGAGYVDALAGEEIPLLARVISVVDAFDSMTSDRPYRKALPVGEAVRRLSDGAGTQWDPDIVPVFLDLVQREGLGQEANTNTTATKAA